MNCPTCGLREPDNIRHKSLDDCAIALTAAQDAVRNVIDSQLEKIKVLQNAKEKGGD